MAVDFHRDVYGLLGLPFDAVDMAGTVQRVRAAVASRTPCLISTANVNFIVGCRADRSFRDSVIVSDLSVADGMPVVWIARLLGIPLRERVTGASLFEALRRGDAGALSVFFFGGPAGAGAAACQRLALERQGLTPAGFESPGYGSIEEMSTDQAIARVNAVNADFLVVSLGAHKGQRWIERNRPRLNVPVISHLGAVLNFTAGSVRRAPAWMQQRGLEWLWRIKEEPALWRRYFADALALAWLLAGRVLPLLWQMQRHPARADELARASLVARDEPADHVIELRGAWTRRNLAPLREAFTQATQSGKHVKLDMSSVSAVDSAFVGLVMLLYGHQVRQGRRFRMMQIPRQVERFLACSCAEYLYSSGGGGASMGAEEMEVAEGADARAT